MFLQKLKFVQAAERRIKRKKLRATITEHEKVVRRSPRDMVAANALGELYAEAGRTGDAMIVFSTVAEHYRAGGFLPRAIAMLKKVNRIDPNSVDALARLGELNERIGRKAEAIEWYRRLATVYDDRALVAESLEINKRIAALDPADAAACSKLAYDLDEVLPGPQGLSEDEFVIKQIFRAEVLSTRGGVNEAITILKEILSYEPDNVPARSKLKDIYLRAGMEQLAVNECLQLARIREARKLVAIEYLEDQLELGLSADEDYPETMPKRARLKYDHKFEFLIDPERRSIERVAMNLPVLVLSEDNGWREFAESVNVSESGILLRLAHSVKPDSILRATLPMPIKLRAGGASRGLYVVNGMVRHASPDPAGDNLVGIEFDLASRRMDVQQEVLFDCH